MLLQGPPGTGKTTTLSVLLTQLSATKQRSMVCAHSNKGVQVLAERMAARTSDLPIIIVGVEKKIPEVLKHLSLSSWYGLIAGYINALHQACTEYL